MKEETLNQGVSLIQKKRRIESFVEGCNKIQLRVEANFYGPEFMDALSPEAKEAVDSRLDEIKQIMVDDFNNQLHQVQTEFYEL